MTKELKYPQNEAERQATWEECWKELQRQVSGCTKCPLSASRNRVVFGDGDPHTDLMFIGEGPGGDEDQQGIPFVGRAGQLFNKILEAAGIGRNEIFITNVVKCRPPSNRNPSIEEMTACDGFLHSQIALINPRLIVCLGNTPTKWILKTTEGITKLRGHWFPWKGIQVRPMFHPSYLLRNASNKTGSPKHLTWVDIQEIKQAWRNGE
ncbi:MAG: uracil-DNA glycosylase [Synergistales bacterium]|nr:uracil-DNA glycosylase [Synergistales bacterium]